MEAWKRYVSWLTMPIASSSSTCFRSRTSSPANSTRPELTSCRRGIRYETVVLPAPDGPTKAAYWPGSMRNDTRSSVGGVSSPASG